MADHYPSYTAGRLDAQSQALLDEIASSPSLPLHALTPERARAEFVRPSWLGACAELAATEDRTIDGPGGALRVRAYMPRGRAPFPVVIFFHGGGFVLGALDEFDPFCSNLAVGAGALVVSVDYRLAPEHKFPAAAHDAITAVRWVAANASQIGGDPTRLVVAGDSAGANLATVAAIVARDEGGPCLVQQVLICPWVDLSSTRSASFQWFGDGPWLSSAGISWYTDHYLADSAQAHDPLASPLLAGRHAGLAPALIIAAEFDVLRDQGAAYACRLREGGTPVEYCQYRGTLHDFVTLPGLFDRAGEAMDRICSVVREAWRRGDASSRRG